MQLPPDEGNLADSMNILFTRSTQKLDDAEWAQVSRTEYLEMVKLRQKTCASFKDVKVDDARAQQ